MEEGFYTPLIKRSMMLGKRRHTRVNIGVTIVLRFSLQGMRKSQVGTAKTFKAYSAELGQTSMSFTYYRTEKKNVTYVDEPGLIKVATATLESPRGPLSDNVENRVTFGYTEMVVEARDADKEEQYPVKVSLDFLCN